MKEKINQYLAGDLEGKELEQFEQQLSEDSQLRAEVERKDKLLEDSIREGIQYYHELQTIVHQIHEKAEKEQLEKPIQQLISKRPLKKGLAAVATIAFLLLTCFLWTKSPTKEQIIAQVETTIPIEVPLTEAGTADLALLEANAEKAFSNKEYEKTKQLCLQILEQDSTKTTILFVKAICELRLENYPIAIQDFEAVEATNVVFKAQATWLKGITYLKKGGVLLCMQVMESLVKNQNATEEYRENAKTLLNELRNLD